MERNDAVKECNEQIRKLDSDYGVLYKHGFYDGFLKGVEFAQSKAFFERLDEDEKMNMRKWYSDLINGRKNAIKIKDYFTYGSLLVQISMLEEIFGAENLNAVKD